MVTYKHELKKNKHFADNNYMYRICPWISFVHLVCLSFEAHISVSGLCF